MDDNRVWFGRNGPFYPFVANFWISMHGVMDLISRRTIDVLRESDDLHPLFKNIPDSILEPLRGSAKTPQLSNIDLRSNTEPDISLDISELEVETFNEFLYLSTFSAETPLRMLLICCYEATKNTHRIANDPVWEFFRHCRNAAAHNGKFTFNNDEPRRTATWRGLSIDLSLESNNLLSQDDNENAFLQPGDVIHLLADLEATFNPRS